MKKLFFETTREDRFFVIPVTLMFVAALIVTGLDFVVLQKMVYHFEVVNALGLFLFVIGIVMRALGKRTLGEYYAYGLRILPNQKLVKHGIYKHIRHPITLAALIYSTGIPLFFSSLYGFIVMLAMIPFFLYRIEIEEKMLVEKFRDEYCEYIKHTKKIIPFVY